MALLSPYHFRPMAPVAPYRFRLMAPLSPVQLSAGGTLVWPSGPNHASGWLFSAFLLADSCLSFGLVAFLLSSPSFQLLGYPSSTSGLWHPTAPIINFRRMTIPSPNCIGYKRFPSTTSGWHGGKSIHFRSVAQFPTSG